MTASASVIWSGSCTGVGANPSTQGVFVFTNGGACTVTFPSGAGGPGAGCTQPSDCATGLDCANGVCRDACVLDPSTPGCSHISFSMKCR